jgi:predicted DNA-binding transcriptional regulator AlpA
MLKAALIPRLIDESSAAAYLGFSRTRFRDQVEAGALPQPVTRNGNRRLWDRHLLDRYVDALSGLADTSDSWAD